MSKNPKRDNSNKLEQEITKKIKISEEDSNKYNRGRRMVKLYCPAVSKITEIMALDEQRLDLGNIARIFGLEPVTLKLNGHFICRGVDLIASSVTWKSLLSYFSSKGLSTGLGSSAALVVDGKLSSKSAPKRPHEPAEIDNGIQCTKLHEEGERVVGSSSHSEEVVSTKKLKESKNALEWDSQTARHCDTGLKRRRWVKHLSPFKKVRVSGSFSNEDFLGSGENKGSCIPELHCGYQITETMKRRREDEFIVSASCKRTR